MDVAAVVDRVKSGRGLEASFDALKDIALEKIMATVARLAPGFRRVWVPSIAASHPHATSGDAQGD